MILTEHDLKLLAKERQESILFLEKEYALTCLLLSIAALPSAKRRMIFKGGGALRRIYFPDWRFMEDLEFSVPEKLERKELNMLAKGILDKAEREFGLHFQLREIYSERRFARLRLLYTGPLRQANLLSMDVSLGETLALPTHEEIILCDPFPLRPGKLLVVAIEELLAEKLRNLLLYGEPKDFYDAWRILTEHAPLLDAEDFRKALELKCQQAGFDLEGPQDFLDKELLTPTRAYWEIKLGDQVKDLPPFEQTVAEFRQALPTLFPT